MSNIVAFPGGASRAPDPDEVSVYAVANRIIAYGVLQAGPGTPGMTTDRIQALAYLACGHHLAQCGRPLCQPRPQCWAGKPGFAGLTYALHTYGTWPVSQEIRGPGGIERMAAGDSRRLVDRVCLTYAHEDWDVLGSIAGNTEAILAGLPDGGTIPDAVLHAQFRDRPLPT